MRITTDEKGYVTGWSIAGDEEGILCQDPADFDRFAAFYQGYRYENGKPPGLPNPLSASAGFPSATSGSGTLRI